MQHSSLKIWQTLKTWHQSGRRSAIATVVKTSGSSPRATGSHLILDDLGNIEGSVSGGCIEAAVIGELQECLTSGGHKKLSFDSATDDIWSVGLSCGGAVEVFVETTAKKIKIIDQILSQKTPFHLITDLQSGDCHLTPIKEEHSAVSTLKEAVFYEVFKNPTQLIIIGAVHIAQSLCQMAQHFDLHCTVIDPRTAFASETRIPHATLILEWPETALNQIEITSNTAVVTLTHDPKFDEAALGVALKSKAFYIAALGSKKTQAQRNQSLKNNGFSAEEIARIHGPAGLDIGAKTPAEIALSILAELISIRRGKTLKRDGA